MLEKDKYMLVVNASNIEKDWNWIKENNSFDVKLVNDSDNITLLAVQGPKASDVMMDLTDIDLNKMKYYTFEKGTFAGVEDVLISATGYTGAGGFEIYFANEHAEHIWSTVMEKGESFGIKPIGLGARDTLRLEMGYCLYGNDIDDSTSPLEAGLGWITKLNGRTFNSSDIFRDQKESGITKKLVGFEMIERGIPRHGYDIKDSNGNKIGSVTSGTQSPSLNKGIGMGYVHVDMAQEGNEINIDIRNKQVKAVIIRPPFIKN